MLQNNKKKNESEEQKEKGMRVNGKGGSVLI